MGEVYLVRPQPWAARAAEDWTRMLWGRSGRWFVFGGCLFWLFFIYAALIWYAFKLMLWLAGIAIIGLVYGVTAGWDLATYPHRRKALTG